MLIRRGLDHDTFSTQAHHALISGVLASAWRANDDVATPLTPALCHAIGLHDLPWQGFDRMPARDPQTGHAQDFIAVDLAVRLPFYQTGIDQLEAIDPFTACLVSLHYTAFTGLRVADAFQQHERARQQRLYETLGEHSDVQLAACLPWLQFFDLFSLYVCLAGPHTRPDTLPTWLANLDWAASTPDARRLTLQWLDDTTLSVSPNPFFRPLHINIVGRHLPSGPFCDDATLQNAFRHASNVVRCVHVR